MQSVVAKVEFTSALSLQRTVALKVLPLAAVMDEKAITRFKNEARAAGTLHHDNIVPVHGVGTERGVHYYAMALINGVTVADVIHELKQSVLSNAQTVLEQIPVDRVLEANDVSVKAASGISRRWVSASDSAPSLPPPTDADALETVRMLQNALSTRRSLFGSRFFEQVARIGMQTAEALHHAHEHGIVHRDIKPGNLMVDPTGKVWVTDFGLARIESDVGMTMTGDVLGTLRYMAPEQALGKRIMVDHRADIYSLGATLYELLTLRPVFEAVNREELLKQLTFEEPKPIRKVHPAVPVDLETVVMKAIAKDPDERYATASEMADDLRAIRNNQPILAKPFSVQQRIRRWALRHQGLVVGVAATLLISTLSLVIAALVILDAKSRTTAALDESRQSLQEAERNMQTAMDAVERLLANVSNPELPNIPVLQETWVSILAETIDFYERFETKLGGSPEVAYRAAKVFLQFGQLMTATKPQTEDIIRLYERGLDLAQTIVLAEPKRTDFRELLAKLHVASADYYWRPRHMANKEDDAKTLQHLNEAKKIYAQLFQQNPYRDEYARKQGFVFSHMATFIFRRNSRDPRIENYHRRAAELGYEQPYHLKAEYVSKRDSQLATQYWRKAIVSYQSGHKDNIRDELTPTYNRAWWFQLAASALAEQYPNEAEWILQEAIRTSFLTLQDFPSHRVLRETFDVASSKYSRFLFASSPQQDALAKINGLIKESSSFHRVRAELLRQLGDQETRLQALTDAISEYPAQAAYYLFRADLLHNRKRFDDALLDLDAYFELDHDARRRGLALRGAILEGLGKYELAVSEYTKMLQTGEAGPYVFKRRGFAHFQLGDFKQALSDIEVAIQRAPADLTALIWIPLGKIAACPDEGFRTGMLQLADRVVELNDKSPQLKVKAIVIRARLLAALDQVDRALTDLEAAIPSLQAAANDLNYLAWTFGANADTDPRLVRMSKTMAEKAVSLEPQQAMYWNTLGVAQYRDGNFRDAISSLNKSLELDEPFGMDFPFNAFFLAMAHRQLDQQEEACRWYEKGMQWMTNSGSNDEKLLRFRAEAKSLLETIAPARDSSDIETYSTSADNPQSPDQ